MASIDEQEEFEFRLRAEQEAAIPTQPAAQQPEESNWYDPDRLAANPLTTFAVGAAKPILGAMELIPGDIGRSWAARNEQMKQLAESGRKKLIPSVAALSKTMDVGGEMASPVFGAMARAMPAAQTVPGMMKQGAAIGGAAGLTAPTGTAVSDDPEAKLLQGGIGMGVGGVATPVIGSVIRGATNIIAPTVSKTAQDRAAARMAVKASGDRAQNVSTRLQAGSQTGTAADTALPAGSSEFSSLMSIVKGHKGTEFGDLSRAEEVARQKLLKSVSPDLALAEAKRAKVSEPFYTKAKKARVVIDGTLESLFARMPKGTMEAAAEIARMDARPFIIGKAIPAHQVPSGVLDAQGNQIMRNVPAQQAKITGESLHFIKRALSDISNAKDPTKGIGQDAQKSARGVLEDFLPVFESKVPAYGHARKIYAHLSKPIDQAKVIKEMSSVLEKPAGGERVTPFLNTLGRGENALLKRSTGFPKYEDGDLQKVLSPTQFRVVTAIANDMKSGAELSAREVEGMKNALMAIRATENKEIRGPGLINYKVTILNKILNALEGAGGVKTERKLAELGMPGNQAKLGRLMQQQLDKPKGMLGDAVKYQGGLISEAVQQGEY